VTGVTPGHRTGVRAQLRPGGRDRPLGGGGIAVAAPRFMHGHTTDPRLPPVSTDHPAIITADHPAVPPGAVEPFPDRDHVPAEVEHAFDHPEKVGHPDGVPHDVVGRIAISSVLLAAIGVFAYFAFGLWIALTVGVVAAWILFHGLPRRARKERTTEAFHDVHDVHTHGDPRLAAAERDGEKTSYSVGSKDHV
jgi:hypothetical protein